MNNQIWEVSADVRMMMHAIQNLPIGVGVGDDAGNPDLAVDVFQPGFEPESTGHVEEEAALVAIVERAKKRCIMQSELRHAR